MSSMLSDLMSSSPVKPAAPASGNAGSKPAERSGEASAFRDSFARESGKWEKKADTDTTEHSNPSRDGKPPAESAKAPREKQTEGGVAEQPESPAGVAETPAEEVVESFLLVAHAPGGEALVPTGAAEARTAEAPLAGLSAADLMRRSLAQPQPASPTLPLPEGEVDADQPGNFLQSLGLHAKAVPAGLPAEAGVNALASRDLPAATGLASAIALTGGATGGKTGFKLEAWQFGRVDLASRGVSDEAAGSSVSAPVSPLASGLGTGMADAAGARLQIPVNIAFGQPQWANSVAERSAWLFSQKVDNAELQLDPPELGRVNVHIQVHNNDQASVTFTSGNANVRDALDQSAQRLRDLLAEQGLDLVNVDVSDQRDTGQQEGSEGEPRLTASGEPAGEGDSADADVPLPGQTHINLGVDHYV